MEKRDNRSNHYQHLFAESSYSNEMMEAFSNEFSLYNRLNPFEYNEDLMDLEEQLKKEFWRIVDTLTERQRMVIRLLADGHTQMEVAKMLNVNQSSITKCLVHDTLITEAKTGEEIMIGDLVHNSREFWVLALATDGKVRERQVVDVMHNGRHPVLTLQTSTHSITGTGNHPFWTPKGWVNLDSVCVGDSVGIMINGDVTWDEVISIEADGVEDVYDLTVEEDHNFVANGFIVHNSVNGNVDYGKHDAKDGKKPTVYGGSRKKLKRLLAEDPKIQEILGKMEAIRIEKW